MNPQLNFLSRDEIKNLANATAHWIAYKRLTGFGRLFSEASLLVPISEYFFANQWTVNAEQDCHEIFENIPKGTSYFDLVAEKSPAKLFCETKFMKTNDYRLLKDILKLATPRDPSYQRLLIVASEDERPLVKQLQETKQFAIQRSENTPSLLWDGKPHKASSEINDALQRAHQYGSGLEIIELNCEAGSAPIDGRKTGSVVVFSLKRN